MSFIEYKIDSSQVESYTEEMKARIIVGLRLGVRDAIVGLDKAVMAMAMPHLRNTPGQKPNDLLQNIIQRAMNVFETENAIIGIIRPRNAGLQPHYWLEHGTMHKEVHDTLMVIEGNIVNSREAFATMPRPIFQPAFEQYKTAMFEVIQASVEKAMTA